MNDVLTRANIALFKGDYGEARRLLDAYRAGSPAGVKPPGMVLWLEAQVQPDQESRIRGLRDLVEAAPPGDVYAGMAREYLAEVDAYARSQRWGLHFPRAARWLVQAALFAGVGAALALIGAGLINPPPAPSVQTVIITATPAFDAQATLSLPDNSQQLVEGGFQARYAGGILQLRAVEDPSQRVVDDRTGDVIEPVPGARFYGLLAAFECRDSICDAPPQADLALQTDAQALIPLREDVLVYGQPIMQPVALGRTTEGWLIFELPVMFRPAALIITPVLPDGSQGEALTIPLPSTG